MRNLSKISILGIFISILYFTLIFLSVNFAGLSFLDATKDNPIIRNDESIFQGIISNIGLFLWILSLSLNLYAYVINKKSKIFLIGAIYSAFLLIVDLFDFQNSSFQNTIYFFLANSAFFVFFSSSKLSIIKNKSIILFVSFSLFFAAMIMDILQGYINVFIPYLYTSSIEELFEFLGGAFYLFYWIEVIRKINRLQK